MDEVAFVDSLLAPEMRTAAPTTAFSSRFDTLPIGSPPTSCGRAAKFSLAAEYLMPQLHTPHPRSMTTSANGNSLYHQQQQQPDDPLFVRLTMGDDEVFGHLLTDNVDFDGTCKDQVDHAGEEEDPLSPYHHQSYTTTIATSASNTSMDQPPSSTHSLMLEPLELLPKSAANSGINGSDPQLSFKDVFAQLDDQIESAPTSISKLISPPSSFTSANSAFFRQMLASRAGPFAHQLDTRQTDNETEDPTAEYPDEPTATSMGVQSLRSEFNPTSLQTIPTIQALQSAIWSNVQDPEALQRGNNPNSLKHVLMASQINSNNNINNPPSSTNSLLAELLQPSPPPSGGVPLWISASMLTPTTTQLPVVQLDQKISTKRSKARKSSKANTNAPAVSAAALKLSLQEVIGTKRSGSFSSDVDPDTSTPVKKKQRRTSVGNSSSSDTDSSSTKTSTTSKGKKCIEPNCTRRAQSNSRCKAHGGGARCQYAGAEGCSRSSQGGGFCRAHGGGKRCEFPGCERGQQRKGRCYVHGGIRKCQMGDCEKKDRGNGFCISHGGGKRCEFPGCSRSVRRGQFCHLHFEQ